MVWSRLPEASVLPSGLKAVLHTAAVWSVSGGSSGWRLATSHKRIVLSSLPEARIVPSGLKTTLHTEPGVAGEGWPRGYIPQDDLLLPTAGGQSLPVGTKGRAP
jgi:hypothetical protein